MADFRFSHRMLGERLLVQGDSSSFCCLELGFHIIPAQAADVEFLLGITFLLEFWFKLHFELAAVDKAVISVALCTRQHSCVQNVFQVPFAHEHIVK